MTKQNPLIDAGGYHDGPGDADVIQTLQYKLEVATRLLNSAHHLADGVVNHGDADDGSEGERWENLYNEANVLMTAFVEYNWPTAQAKVVA